jgi:ketosteroid isomerase-like protein
MSTPVTIVRRFHDALGRGDVPAVLSLLDAQVEWTEAECPGSLSASSPTVGGTASSSFLWFGFN